jgi:curved DNA-binding protein CbpA
MAMDDYYELLDVAPDSERNDIRVAYRAKRDALQSEEGAQSRAKVAELNRAWNVLSDPAQRERYDERLAEHRDSDGDEYDDDDADDDEADGNAAAPAKRPRAASKGSTSKAATRAEQRQAARAAAKRPPRELPNGLTHAQLKSRGFALMFDLAVLLLIFSLAQAVGVRIIDHKYPGQTTEYNALVKKVNAANSLVSADGKKASAAAKAATTAGLRHDSAARTAAENAEKAANDNKKKDTNTSKVYAAQKKTIGNRLTPASFLLFAAEMLLVLLYTVPSTALTGQTLGKRLRKIRVVKLDGSPPGFSTTLIRFGVPVMIALLLWNYLQQLALGVVLLGMIGWINNASKQGLHDRLAKTAVVDA